jgi:hypothetical protein
MIRLRRRSSSLGFGGQVPVRPFVRQDGEGPLVGRSREGEG